MNVETTTPSGGPRAVVPEGPRPFGPAAAVMLAAGLGIFILGLLTTIAEASTGFADSLSWNDRVGPLSGKTIIATCVFFAAWGLLTPALRRSEPPWKPVVYGTCVLVALGLVLTFPTFFEAFAPD
jgi:hypothetical protein